MANNKKNLTYQKATVLYVADIEKVKLDVVYDSSWCFDQKIPLEEGVTVEFKAGNSVRLDLKKIYIIRFIIVKKQNICQFRFNFI